MKNKYGVPEGDVNLAVMQPILEYRFKVSPEILDKNIQNIFTRNVESIDFDMEGTSSKVKIKIREDVSGDTFKLLQYIVEKSIPLFFEPMGMNNDAIIYKMYIKPLDNWKLKFGYSYGGSSYVSFDLSCDNVAIRNV